MGKENINDRTTFLRFLGVWGCSKHFVHNDSNLRTVQRWAKLSMSVYYYFFSILLDSLYSTECVQYWGLIFWTWGVGKCCLLGWFLFCRAVSFFTVVLYRYFWSLTCPMVIPCTKWSNIDLEEYLGCSWITRNQLLSEAPEKFLFLLITGQAAQRSAKLY